MQKRYLKNIEIVFEYTKGGKQVILSQKNKKEAIMLHKTWCQFSIYFTTIFFTLYTLSPISLNYLSASTKTQLICNWDGEASAIAQHTVLYTWIKEQIAWCRPDKVVICNGTEEEFQKIAQEMVAAGKMIQLNPDKRPGSFWCGTSPDDISYNEKGTYICSKVKEDAGPTNNWYDPEEMKMLLKPLFQGCMAGRTMYVIVYSMGPVSSPFSYVGVELTDSPYVVCNMHKMTTIGIKAIKQLGSNGKFIRGLHSVGMPLEKGQKDVTWPCNPSQKHVAYFPEEKEVWSFGSGFGGNAFFSRSYSSLRIMSVIAKENGWLAEHMLILKITNPKGIFKYIAAALPNACGKTNMAMLMPTIPGWKVECIGEDIAWLNVKSDGKLYALNPEIGFFAIAPGTSMESNPNAMNTISHNTIFTNVARTKEGDVWWEGMTKVPPENLLDWQGNCWDPNSGEKAAHPNSRYTVLASQCPMICPDIQKLEGVPISAIIFGGRRSNTIPLVYQSFNWQHGVFLGTTISSEIADENIEATESKENNPFAMRYFCGYNMGHYFSHWLKIGKKLNLENQPKIFCMNYFQKDKQGRFIWPGFGENVRILEWVFNRVSGLEKDVVVSPIGYLPNLEKFPFKGLKLSDSMKSNLFKVDLQEWKSEIASIRSYYKIFGDDLPKEMSFELNELEERFAEMTSE